MKYLSFEISNYRAIEGPLVINLEKSNLIPLVGINECGKTTILQAIYCFDSTNDDEYEGKHLNDTKNLYHPKSQGDPSVKAEIGIRYSEFKNYYEIFSSYYNKKISNQISELDDVAEENKIALENKLLPEKLPFEKTDFKNIIIIKRNLFEKKYKFLEPNLLSLDDDAHDEFCIDLISYLPYVLYNDDFMDRPPTYIDIPKNRIIASGWPSIFERLFKSTSDEYSLLKLATNPDNRLADSILSDVETFLNQTLSKAWKTFLLGNHGAITIKLKYAPFQNDDKKYGRLEIKVVEKIEQRDRYFDVIDRSKGFLWFFNFVMKLEFNPKFLSENPKANIYLLDEPGSYLHYSAQEKLCSKLVEISKRHGIVIYCTHSHTLLNPSQIPLNNIYIIEKDSKKRIKATPLPQVKTKIENSNAYQPILEALQISAFHYGRGNEKIIAVEGIYDKYAIELMIDLEEETLILPGTSANSIVKNIQFLNGFNKKYVAIWDNDEEGIKNYNDAKKFFGDIESQKFDLLPKGLQKKRRMETMFKQEDLIMIKTELGYDQGSTYERALSGFYFCEVNKKKKIKNLISIDTLNNFEILKEIITKRFHGQGFK